MKNMMMVRTAPFAGGLVYIDNAVDCMIRAAKTPELWGRLTTCAMKRMRRRQYVMPWLTPWESLGPG
jgi:hypothetical protein